MKLWHLTSETPRVPVRVSPGERVTLHLDTWPIEPGQAVWVEYQVVHRDGTPSTGLIRGAWQYNAGPNSFWQASFGPFADGNQVSYTVRGRPDLR